MQQHQKHDTTVLFKDLNSTEPVAGWIINLHAVCSKCLYSLFFFNHTSFNYRVFFSKFPSLRRQYTWMTKF